MEFKDIEQTPYTAPTQIPHAAVHAGIDALEMTLTHGAARSTQQEKWERG